MVFGVVMTVKKTFPGVHSTIGFENTASAIKEVVRSKWAGPT